MEPGGYGGQCCAPYHTKGGADFRVDFLGGGVVHNALEESERRTAESRSSEADRPSGATRFPSVGASQTPQMDRSNAWPFAMIKGRLEAVAAPLE